MFRELALRPLRDDVESFVKETMVLPTLDENSGIRVERFRPGRPLYPQPALPIRRTL